MNKLNRRDFLKISGIASGGLLITFSIPARAATLRSAASLASPAMLNAFLRIGEDNRIHIILSKVEMGQGIWTTLPMLIAEELDCDWSSIKVEHSPPGKTEDFLNPPIDSSTGGSLTTVSEFERYRLAGATARTMLISAAAQRLGVLPEACKTENSYVIAGDKRVSYGEVASEASTLPIPVVKLRDTKEWKYIGKSQKRLDCPEKINGKARYGLDIQFPGLLTAVVAHPPVFGATVKSYDATQAKAIQGVRDIVQIPTGIAVVADHFWAAKVGRDALKIEWDLGANSTIDSSEQLKEYSRLAATKGLTVQQKGDVVSALQNSEKVMDVEYSFPYLAHAPMEPLNCSVKISDNKCEIWTGTQSPLLHQAEVAAFLNIRPEQ